MNTHFDYTDPSVFNKIFDNHYRGLILFAKSMVGDNEVARDLVADSFVKLWDQKPQFSTTPHLVSYFYIAIKNRCIDYLRKEKFKANVEQQLMQTTPLTENAIEIRIHEAQIIQQLYIRINKLPSRMQQVFKLSYLEGLTRAEVAKQINLSENTIRNTNAAAMKAIRIQFGKDEMQS